MMKKNNNNDDENSSAVLNGVNEWRHKPAQTKRRLQRQRQWTFLSKHKKVKNILK